MSRLRRIFLAMALALVLAPLVANAPLFDPDEGLHAAIAQEMVLRGDYVTPTFLGEPFLDKPILFFWAEAASLRILGNREAAVRLPPLLFGVLGMIGVAALGRAVFDERTGLLAGIVYGTMLVPLGVSQVAVHDVAVVPFMCAACMCLVDRLKTESTVAGSLARNRVARILCGGVALGLSILTKGLVAIVFTGLFGLCLVIEDRTRLMRVAMVLVVSAILALLVALPWYVAMEHAHPGYLYYYFVERHLQGYLTATQRHAGRGWWYYLPIVIGGTLPWTGYLVAAIGDARASRRRLAVAGWFVLGLVFLSAGESKLVTYALPLFPALALLVADAIATRGSFASRAGYSVFAASLALLPIGGLALVQWKFGPVGSIYWVITGLASAAIAIVSIVLSRSRFTTLEDAAAVTLRLPVMALCGLMIVAPRAAAWMSARDLAAVINGGAALPSQVLVLDERIGSLVFYLAPPLRAEATSDRVDQVTLPEAISRIRVAAPDAIIAVRDDQLARFRRLFPTPPVPDAHAGTFSVFRAGSLALRQAEGARD
jgi:4-amino-4-deoxy-L-arabinose transferase-like glycosyltransferase